MNRASTPKQIMQPGTRVSVDSTGGRRESPLTPSRGEGMREYTTGLKRRSKTAGLKSGGAVKKSGKKGC